MENTSSTYFRIIFCKSTQDKLLTLSKKLCDFVEGLVAESVEKLPETYMRASTKDIVNELHNTIHRIQV